MTPLVLKPEAFASNLLASEPKTTVDASPAVAFNNKRKLKPRGRPFEHGNTVGNRFKLGQSGNPGGRPKIIYEESAAYLREKDKKTGKTNARKMIEALGELATNPCNQTVAAFRAIRELVEPASEGQDQDALMTGAQTLSNEVILNVCRAVAEKKLRAIDVDMAVSP